MPQTPQHPARLRGEGPINRRAFIAHAATRGWASIALAAIPGPSWRWAAVTAPPSILGRWLARAPLPVERQEVGVATVDGKVYVLGGYANGRVGQPLNQ